MKEKTNNPVPNFFLASAEDFKKIPGSPIAYWVSDKIFKCFDKNIKLGNIANTKSGMSTTDNQQFLRLWHEISWPDIGFNFPNTKSARSSGKKWFPYSKGGFFRKWYGNQEYVVNWQENGRDIRACIAADPAKQVGGRIVNEESYFLKGVGWSDLTSGHLSARLQKKGFLFDSVNPISFPHNKFDFSTLLGLLNSSFANLASKIINPTLHFTPGNARELPLPNNDSKSLTDLIQICTDCISVSSVDWDSYETSWDFTNLPLLNPSYHKLNLPTTYSNLRTHWRDTTLEMQNLEQENNRIFIEAYNLQDELTPEVPLNEITLTCNPHYRYNGDKTENELEDLLLADTMKEFISYAVGCMFGRYSLDEPGLILANQGETIDDYIKKVPNPTFEPDSDNVIPILDGDLFIDDIADRFRRFLRVTFGEEHYEENLKFIEDAIGKNIRKYFLKDFYNHHVKIYKKRPIYWMFSSPNGSFNALIYMHRYRPDTVSVVLNNYLREFRSKIAAKKENLEDISSSPSSSQSDKTKALKEIEKLKKIINELEDYERDILYPLATQQIEIDLDDGVKVNYNKFGKALRKVPGLSS